MKTQRFSILGLDLHTADGDHGPGVDFSDLLDRGHGSLKVKPRRSRFRRNFCRGRPTLKPSFMSFKIAPSSDGT